eukprot:SAG22_NODE_168_length_16723_cov_6.542409_4_plen_967_part_00
MDVELVKVASRGRAGGHEMEEGLLAQERASIQLDGRRSAENAPAQPQPRVATPPAGAANRLPRANSHPEEASRPGGAAAAGQRSQGDSVEAVEEHAASSLVVETSLSSLLGVIMGTVGGLTAGATIMWPPDTNEHQVPPEYRTYGLIVCLLSGVVTNVVYCGSYQCQLRGSKLPCGVGGTNYPAIICAQKQIEKMFTADEPNDVLAAYMIISVACGVLTVLAAQFRLLRPIVKAVPYPVMLGFLTSIGVGLLFKALSVIDPAVVVGACASGSASACTSTVDALIRRVDIAVPGIGMAIVIFALQNIFQPCGAECLPPPSGSRFIKFLVPLVALIMFGFVDVVMVPTRSGDPHGLLLNTTQADVFALLGALSPWNVTVDPSRGKDKIHWNKFAEQWPILVLAILTTFVIGGILGIVEDLIIALKTNTKYHARKSAQVDFDDEVGLQGGINVACGIVGAMPANVVGSYSMAVIPLGASGKVFYAMQAIGSAVAFLFASTVINRIPKVVPCFVLFHVGLSITKWGLWDGRPEGWLEFGNAKLRSVADGPTREGLDPGEYLLVVLMVVAGLHQSDISGYDVTPVIQFAVGMLFAFANTIMLQRSHILFGTTGDLAHLRSDVLRSEKDSSILMTCGTNVLVCSFMAGSISFHNAGIVIDSLEERVRDHSAPDTIWLVVLDVSLVSLWTYDGAAVLTEFLHFSAKFHFRILLCGCSNETCARLAHFGINIQRVERAELDGKLRQSEQVGRPSILCAMKHSDQLQGFTISRSSDELVSLGLNGCLELIENNVLAETNQSERTRSDIQLKSELNPILDEALREIVSHSPRLAESPCLSLCVELHTKLHRFCGTYDPRLLALVSEHVEVASFAVGGQPIYKFDAEDCSGDDRKRIWQSAYDEVSVPPLVWLLSGAAEHHWTGGSVAGFSHLRDIEDAYSNGSLERVERAEVPHGVQICLGPFQTHVRCPRSPLVD